MKLTQAPTTARRLLRAAMPSTPPPVHTFYSLLLLAAMLVAASVLLVHDARPAVADHGDEETYWSATLTVQSFGAAGIQRGCDNDQSGAQCSTTSVLTDDDFTYGGTSYEVTEVLQVASDVYFVVKFSKTLPADIKSAASLYVDGTAHSLSAATSTALTDGGEQLRFPTSSVAWSPGDTTTLELKRPAAPPSGVELAGTDLDTSGGAGHFDLAVTEGASATFTVALSGDPGTDASITLVNTQYFQSDVGDSDHRWNMNAATVAPQTLTFTGGTSGDWSTPQTVTVTAPQDDDSCSEQLVILVMLSTSGESQYGALGGSITGVHVTVADDDGGSCGGV